MAEHLITRRVGLRRCPRCPALLLTGVTEGVPVHVDPVPVTAAGELAAVLSGRATYTLARGELVHRDGDRDHLGDPVLIAHRCGHPVPPEHRKPLPAPPLVAEHTEPPY
ncbi:MAG TPA: hypothetical protein VF755_02790 [Catenuloplanes sp.]|jgi:hypothetical protein